MERDRIVARVVLVAAIACAAYAALLAATGGFDGQVLGVRIRSRSWQRPALLAGGLFLLSAALGLRSARSAAARAWAWMASDAGGRLLAIAAVAWTLLAGVRFGTFAAGGSDSYAYVSQARLLAEGQLTDEVPMHPAYTWRDAELSLIPLGYRPAAQPGRMAPVPPPGLSLLMTAAMPLGERAIYMVVPVLGALAVMTTWLAGRRVGEPLAGGVAALLLSLSSPFLLMLFSPMSDVPVTALWMAALLFASVPSRGAAGAAGIVTAVAVLIRPNLAPLAVIVAALLLWHSRARSRDIVMFVAPVAAGVAALLAIQFLRYGSAFSSGYGAPEELFATAHIRTNLSRYPRWLTEAYTPVIWLWIASPCVLARGRGAAVLYAAVALIAATWIAYLPYQPFDAWFFTRFLLPAIPMMLLLAVVVVLAGVRRLPIQTRPVVAGAFVLVMAGTLVAESTRRGVFEAAENEQKYPLAGAYVRERLPASAFVLARQHSGSVRLYGARPTIRWDLLGGDQLDLVVATLRSIGGVVYVVADGDELPEFSRHFEGQAALKRLALLARFGQAHVYAVE